MANIDDKKIPKGTTETPIVGRLHDVSEDHVVTGANEVFDDVKKKRQSVINHDTDEHLDVHDTEIADRYTKEEVNNIISRTPETDVIVIEIPAASQSDIAGWLDANTPSGTDPETGRSVRANKLYRVPGPDNTTYSEWAWDGTKYIMLANKDYGIDDEPTPNSNNIVKSSGIKGALDWYVKDYIPLTFIDDTKEKNVAIGASFWGMETTGSLPSNNFVTVCVKVLRNCVITIKRLQLYSAIKYIHVFDSNFRQTELIDISLVNTVNATEGCYYVFSGKAHEMTVKTNISGSLEFFDFVDDFDKLFTRLDELTGVSVPHFFITSNGGAYHIEDWNISDIIDISGYSLIINFNRWTDAYYTFFDADYNYLSSSNVFGAITVPANAQYVQYSFNTLQTRNGLYVLREECQNLHYIKRTYNHIEKTYIDYEGNDYVGKWITNLNSATVGSPFVPNFSSLASYSSFSKYPVYKNSILRVVGKVGSSTNKIIITDTQGFVVKIITMPLDDQTRLMIGINIEENGFLYASFQTNEDWPRPLISQIANVFEAEKSSSSFMSYREPFYMRIRDGRAVKFGILGDSTTDGMGTTGFNRPVNGHEGSQWDNTYNGGGGTIGSTDYINQNAFPYLLEQIIKSESGNQNVRVYNMGWSGKTAKWACDNIASILGGAYSDVEVVGINFGINDSTELHQDTFYDVVEDYRKNICTLIDYMHKKGIYVFLIKHQIVLKGVHETSKARTVNELNDVLDDIGRMYNIPVYDMTGFTKMFSYYSEYGYLTMFQDDLHGKDAIHNVEAGFLMGQLCERVVKVSKLNGDIIAYQGNNIIVSDNIEISKGSSINNGFKEWVLQTNVTQNTLIGDLRIINDTKDPVDLYGFIGNSANTCKATVSKIKENDTEVQIAATDGVKITTLKVGEYASVIIRNNTTTADFLGFKIH